MDAKGQSILEVIFVLPFLFLFVTVLFKLNLAMQTSINNAQYARSQLFVLTANSPEYPRIEFRNNGIMFKAVNEDLMILGVADPTSVTASVSGAIDPIPQTQKIDSTGKKVIGSNEPGEQAKRNEIRVRNTAGICTQMNNPPLTGADRWPFKQTVCQYGGQWIGDAP